MINCHLKVRLFFIRVVFTLGSKFDSSVRQSMKTGCMMILFLIYQLVQLILGIPLEMVHRSWRIAIIYFLGVIAGSLAHSLVDTKGKYSFFFKLRTRNSIRGFVRPSVGRSVRRSVMVIELKTSIFDTFCVCLSVGGGLGCGWGLDAPAHPFAMILCTRVTCSDSF